MAQANDTVGMLDLMGHPGFCVRDGRIVWVSRAAEALLISPGQEIGELLLTGQEEYRAFQEGSLFLTLSLSGAYWSASVNRVDEGDIFLLLQEEDQAELQAMSLASRELRTRLANVMATADQLFPLIAMQNDPEIQEKVADMNRGLYQILRVVSNMSDAGRYHSPDSGRIELMDITKFLRELFDKNQELVAHTDRTLRFTCELRHPVFTLADETKLERAVLNMISNALKFTPKGGVIDASLTRSGHMLRLTLQDNGDGMASGIQGSAFRRYLRQPTAEDSRFGLGLGMVIIRATAAVHGGTVLLDSRNDKGFRISMTIRIRENPHTTVQSPSFRIDYAGERDHSLIELSESLPASLYASENIN